MRVRGLIVLVALCLAPCVFAADTGAAMLTDFEKSVTEFTLSNGMKFIIVRRPEVPTVSFHLYVDVGAVDEVTGITGVSHLFEHMAFKGTRTIGTKNYESEKLALDKLDKAYLELEAERNKGPRADAEKVKKLEAAFQAAQGAAEEFRVTDQFSQILDRNGAVGLNASTSYDATRYFFSLPSNKLELWFSLESARFLDPVTRDYYKERNVVVEERRMRTESSPIGKLIEEFLATAYKSHPYGQPVVGHFSEISKLRRAEAEKYFKDYYVAEAMTAALVGDVDPKEAKRLAETYFGRLPKRPKKDSVRTQEPPQEGERRVALEVQSQPFVIMGFHKPSVVDKDAAVFDVITDILGGGRTSWLYKSLVRDKKIAVAAQAITGIPGVKYPGLFIFFTVPSPGKTTEENEKAVEEQIERLKKEKVSPELLEQVKTRARADIVRELGANSGLAGLLAMNQAVLGDWRRVFLDLDDIGKVTAEDVQRVANQYFQKKNRTVAVIVPPGKTS